MATTATTAEQSTQNASVETAKQGLKALEAMAIRQASSGAGSSSGNGAAAASAAGAQQSEAEGSGHAFRVGWSYDVFLKKNGLAPSESAGNEWKNLSRAASKAQVERMSLLSGKGFKTTCKRSAIWNGKAKCYDTALTARVVEPDCADPDLIRDAYIKAQSRQAKLLSSMRAAAVEQGAEIG